MGLFGFLAEVAAEIITLPIVIVKETVKAIEKEIE